MIYYKLLGAAMLAVSGALGAGMMNRLAALSLQQTEAWLSLIRLTRSQVECFDLSAKQILIRCEGALLRQCGYEKKHPPESFEELVSFCEIKDGRTRQIAEEFAKSFGKGYREEQLRRCTYSADLLHDRAETIRLRLPSQKKLNTTLCLSGALAMVILLL